MTWYAKKLIKIKEEQAKMRSPFSKDLSEPDSHLDAALLIITNMATNEDFMKIEQEFLKVEGIIKVKKYQAKKIQVVYDNRLVTLQHLANALQKTGYNYVRRICKNCMRN